MQTNNAEVQDQEISTEVADTSSTTDETVIEAGDTATGAEVDTEASGVEGEEQSTTESDLYYEIDGEEVSVSTVKEWRKGHMLQSDYTKKSQANAETRKALEAKMAETNEVKSKLEDIVSQLDSVIAKESNPEDLAYLRDTDPSEYLRRKEELAEKQKLSEKAKKELAAAKEQEFKKRTAEEAKKLLEALPDWQNPEKLKVEQALIDDYLKVNEFSDDDVNSLVSHKLMIMARDAALYHKLKKSTADIDKQVQKAPNVVKPKVREKTKPTTRAERFYGNQSR